MKRILKAILIIIGIALMADAFVLGIVGNFNVGIIATFGLGVVTFAYGGFDKQVNKVIPKWLRYVIVFGVCCVLIMTVFLAVYGNVDTADYNEDALIVLGAGIKGEYPSLPLVRRLDRAVEYYKKNPEVVIVVTGGQGFQEDITEALAMERYLVNKGVPAYNIIKEEKATSTYENFRFSKEILDKKFIEEYKIAFVTNDFHIYRASRLAKSAGFETASHISGITEWYTLPVNYLRECLAIVKLWIFKT
ncbi:MAG: YdcF family protein [Eubacteriales bacterium]|nr:YdcF family protein [Eubacteriales bacterium]